MDDNASLILFAVTLGALLAMLALFVGVWLVGKFQFAATGGHQAFNPVKIQQHKGPQHYDKNPIVGDGDEQGRSLMELFTGKTEELSTSAKRIRRQKEVPTDPEDVKRFVRGEK